VDPALAISVEEVHELYRLNAAVSAGDEDLLAAERPAVQDLPAPAELASLLDALKRSEQARPSATARLWTADKQTTESLARLDGVVRETIATLADDSAWLKACLAAGRSAGPEKPSWQALVDEIRRVAREVPLRDELIVAHDPVIQLTKPKTELIDVCK